LWQHHITTTGPQGESLFIITLHGNIPVAKGMEHSSIAGKCLDLYRGRIASSAAQNKPYSLPTLEDQQADPHTTSNVFGVLDLSSGSQKELRGW
jgi:hypothetical protein